MLALWCEFPHRWRKWWMYHTERKPPTVWAVENLFIEWQAMKFHRTSSSRTSIEIHLQHDAKKTLSHADPHDLTWWAKHAENDQCLFVVTILFLIETKNRDVVAAFTQLRRTQIVMTVLKDRSMVLFVILRHEKKIIRQSDDVLLYPSLSRVHWCVTRKALCWISGSDFLKREDLTLTSFLFDLICLN